MSEGEKKIILDRLMTWREATWGGLIYEGGNSRENKTGSWRVKRPIFYPDRCTHCLICWVYCPDNSIIVKDGKITGIDYDFCKGCGICSEECPLKEKAILMEEEKL